MKLQEFKSLVSKSAPPPGMNDSLTAMWYDLKGDWKKSHEITQEISDITGAWIHAYLHRKEGDESNACYWYSRAGRIFPQVSLDDERDHIISELLSLNSKIV